MRPGASGLGTLIPAGTGGLRAGAVSPRELSTEVRVRSARSPACVPADASHQQIARCLSLTRSAQSRKEAFPTELGSFLVRQPRAACPCPQRPGVARGHRCPHGREKTEAQGNRGRNSDHPERGALSGLKCAEAAGRTGRKMRLRKPRQMPRGGTTAALGTQAAAPSAGPGPGGGGRMAWAC